MCMVKTGAGDPKSFCSNAKVGLKKPAREVEKLNRFRFQVSLGSRADTMEIIDAQSTDSSSSSTHECYRK